MDLQPTQAYEDDELACTQKLVSCPQNVNIQQVGILNVNGKEYPINTGINRIGRHPACNIVLNDQTISKQHAEIEATTSQDSAWICDLNSSNRTKLNNVTLRPGRNYELKDGSVIEFGKVRSIYESCRGDDSFVSGTLASTKKERRSIIPDSSDSSLNNSSALEEDISTVPSTQDDSVFRRPSVPRVYSNSTPKSLAPSSSVDQDTDSPQTRSRELDVGKARNKESLGDPDTRNLSETSIDIHDMETQKVSLDDVKNCRRSVRNESQGKTAHDMEKYLDGQDIQDMETQKNIYHMETQRVNKVNVSEKQQATACSVDISELETQKVLFNNENNISKSITDKNVSKDAAEQPADLETSAQDLKLSLTPNFNEQCSQSSEDMFPTSQNLLEGFSQDIVVDDIKEEPQSTSSSPECVRTAEKSDNSSDEENIFDAVTQKSNNEDISNVIRQRIDYNKIIPTQSEDSETDEEGTFQEHPDIKRQTSRETSRKDISDDSDTDEEGQFAEIARRERRATSSFTETAHNESDGSKSNPSTSKDSEDIFEVPTQRVKPDQQKSKSNASSALAFPVEQFDGSDDELAPTQITSHTNALKTLDNNSEVTSRKSSESPKTVADDIDDMAPTQLLHTPEVASGNLNKSLTNKTERKEQKSDSAEIDLLPTQLIRDIPSSAHQEDEKRENDIVDLEYEMAPTQLIGDVVSKKEEQAANSKTTAGKARSTRSRGKTREANLNDTLERNLREMFEDVNERNLHTPVQMSTQNLADVLETSREHTDDGCAQKSEKPDKPVPKECKTSAALAASKTPESTKSNATNTQSEVDSQGTETYFSHLTTRRKCNILKDSQNSQDLIKNASRKTENANDEPPIDNQTDAMNTSKLNTSRSNDIFIKTYERRRSRRSTSVLQNLPTETCDSSSVTSNDNQSVTKIEIATEKASDNPKSSVSCSFTNDEHSVVTPTAQQEEEIDLLEQYPAFTILGTSSNPGSPESTTRETKPKRKVYTKKARKSRSAKNSDLSQETLEAFDKLNATKPALDTEDSGNVRRSQKKVTSRRSSVNSNSDAQTSILSYMSTEQAKLSASKSTLTKRRRVTLDSLNNEVRSSRSGSTISLSRINNKRPCHSDKQDDEEPSVFQGTRVTAEATETDKTAKTRAVRGRKRNTPGETVESTASKKHKTMEDDRRPLVLLHKVPTDSLPNTRKSAPTKSRQSLETNAINETPVNTSVEDVQKTKNVITEVKTKGKRNSARRTRATNSPPGEESQEIQRIMKISLNNVQNSSLEAIEPKTRRRSLKDTKAEEFEVPTSKPKRSRNSKNTSAILDETISKENSTLRGTVKTSSRLTRSVQNTTVNTVISNSSENDSPTKSISETPPAKTAPKKKRSSKIAKNVNETNKEEHNSSESDSATRNTSVLSTPSRTRSSILNSSLSSVSSPSRTKFKVSFTGVAGDEYNKILAKLGGSKIEDVTKCNVLVTDKVRRTVKFLCALALSVPIVSISWLTESEKASSFLNWENYILKDPAAEAKFGFRLRKSLDKSRQKKLLEGYTILLTPNVAPPPVDELKSMVASCGGKTLVRSPAKWPDKTVIVSRNEDLANAKKFLSKAPVNVTVQSTEFILTGILRQELDFTAYRLIT